MERTDFQSQIKKVLLCCMLLFFCSCTSEEKERKFKQQIEEAYTGQSHGIKI